MGLLGDKPQYTFISVTTRSYIYFICQHYLKYTNIARPRMFKQWYNQRLLNIATDSTITPWILFAKVILHIWSRLPLLMAEHMAMEAKMFLTHPIHIKFRTQRHQPIRTKSFMDAVKTERLVSSCK
ncbi:hypothetical protein HYC85_000316 [Camellia sinensis]|uniref:Uncharacterized protein n=1 Tax=Camellia sinensis TaxID=4442 RepID=A0A7J7I3A6_CAMSI|nr:hypothetical protein HYC85_000316 [Camellia sinensis]